MAVAFNGVQSTATPHLSMPQPPPPVALLVYFVVYFLLGTVGRAVLVYRRTGINPLVAPVGDDAYAYVSRAFRFIGVGCAAVAAALAFLPTAPVWLGAYPPLQLHAIAWIGWALLIASLLWVVLAQAQMGASWRIGIDTQHRTELVQTGLFSLSRNPIYLALRVSLLGLFFVFPSAATLALFVATEILIQVLVRLEEQHMTQLHPDVFPAYCSRVRRWL